MKVLHGRSKREEARYGLRASRVGEASHPGPVQTHAAILSVRGRAGCRKMCWMLCSLISPKTIRIRMRRSIKVGTAHPTFNKVWQQLARAKCQRSLLVPMRSEFLMQCSAGQHQQTDQRWPPNVIWHSVSTHFSRHQRFNLWSPHDRGDDWCCCKNQGVHQLHEM